MKFISRVKALKSILVKPFAQQLQKGMTLIEIIIVVALLGTLMTYMIRNLVGTADNAKIDQTKLAVGNIVSALQTYRIHNSRFPTTDLGLDALVTNPSGNKKWRGPYIEKKQLADPWGNEFQYESDGTIYKIISAGLDGAMGTGDDLTFPEADDTNAAPAEGGGANP